MLLLACLPVAAAGHAQESRQDASVSGAGFFPRAVNANAVHESNTIGYGLLGSYRYMVTPHLAGEANYGFDRDIFKYASSQGYTRVHTQFQEFSAEAVYSAFSYHNLYPFIEGGIGGYLFGIINDSKTSVATGTLKSSTTIGVPFGGGVAYELSPSFDIRVAYRGIVVKAPSFNAPSGYTNTGRYFTITNPVIGVAYHF
ncbi:MAG TPA: outer membrane beta-barrel protein [Acidobacteriaceae bacterium]